MIATLIILFCAVIAIALFIAFAGREGQARGWTSPRAIGAIVAAVVVVALVVWAVWVKFDAPNDTAGPAGYAGNNGPVFHVEHSQYVGVASAGVAPR